MKTLVSLSAIAVAMLVSWEAHSAQFSFTSQNRSLSVNAHSETINGVTDDDVNSATASDFADFVQSRSAFAETFAVHGTCDVTASQNSSLGAFIIMASGVASADAETAVSFQDRTHGIGSSLFASTFTLDAPSDVEVKYQLSADRLAPAFVTSASPTASFSLTGGATNVAASLSIPNAGTSNSTQFSQIIFLAAGTYDISATANVEARSRQMPSWSDGICEASYSISVTVVPEPSTFALLALGALGICLHRARRRVN
jgi:hypothetical protein